MPLSVPFAMHGASAAVPDLFHATRFDAPDPVSAVRFPDGRTWLLVSSMEYGRARRQARGCEVFCAATLGIGDIPPGAPEGTFLARVLAREGCAAVAAAPGFPLGVALTLEAAGIRVALAEDSPVAAEREIKAPGEVRAIRASQRAARAALKALGEAIRRAEPDGRGRLALDGAPFTSERARALVRSVLLAHGTMDFEGTIVAGGDQAADPHESGHGPLRAGRWIVADVFPRSLRTGYWGDMTRTFLHGRPTPEQRRMFDAVADAQRIGLDAVRPGATGREVHEAVRAAFDARGFRTGRAADGRPFGFIHSTGHGVGLEIHESPRLSPAGGPLRPGMVVTVEPGLYYPGVGGVRIEDTVLVTEDGCEIL